MRLLAITVRNYRVHRELSVELDPALTVIGGPNEAGKSTLMEAAHRALFLRCSVGGGARKEMESTLHGGVPEVKVTFEAGGKRYTIEKRFSGQSGTARLEQEGAVTLTSNDAEEKLAQLLGVDPDPAKHTAAHAEGYWGHLFIRQGTAFTSPDEQINSQRDGLLARLQREGGAALMQSNRDTRVSNAINAWIEKNLTQKGDPKKDSDVSEARLEHDVAQSNVAALRQRLEQLRQAATDFEEATESIRKLEESRTKLEADQRDVAAKLSQANDFSAQLEVDELKAKGAKDNLDACEKADAEIKNLRDEVKSAEDQLAPRAAELEGLRQKDSAAQQHLATAEAAYEKAIHDGREIRLKRDWSTACVEAFQKSSELAKVQIKWEQARVAREELAKLRDSLSKLPMVTRPKLTKLQQLEREAEKAWATFHAMAASIEVIAADSPVQIGDKNVKEGQSEIITDVTEVRVGKTRLRIRPGGGGSLDEARRAATQAQRAQQEMLNQLGVADVAAAVTAQATAQQIESDISAKEERLEALGNETIDAELGDAKETATAAIELAKRRGEGLKVENPANLEAAQELLRSIEKEARTAEQTESRAKSARDAAATAVREAKSSYEKLNDSLAKEKDQLQQLRAKLEVLLKQNGSDDARDQKLKDFLAKFGEADRILKSTRANLDKLQPDLLENDKRRIDRALGEVTNQLQKAGTKRDVAQISLRGDGAADPQAALDMSAAKLAVAADHLQRAERKTRAFELLLRLFKEEQDSLSERFTAPLASKITEYLRCIFGPDACAAIRLEGNAFGGIELERSSGPGRFGFDALSGGTKEQLAAASRLATAEVLAAESDRCLPLVFDDGFAYSDPKRIREIQRMLDRAASQGLQIIILTCNPADYDTLGARRIAITARG